MAEQTRGGFYISQIKQIGDRIFERLLKANDIAEFNGPQGRILYVLWGEDHLAIHELSVRTSLAKTTLTGMLDRMEKQGYLQRIYDPADRRKIRLRLTEKARNLRDRYQAVSNQMNDIFYQGLGKEEIRQFDDLLAKVLDNLKSYEG